jgi:hypothetical protein
MTSTPPQLKRTMKLTGALFLTLSSITPAASVFIIAPGVVQQAGTGAFLSFVLAAIINIFTALTYAELSSAFPLTGGEYAIVGRLLGPLPGFMILGVNFATLTLTAAVVALGLGNYINVILPDVSPIAAGVVCVMFTTLCGILNIRTNAFVTGMFLIIEMLALIVLSYLGFAHISRPFSDFILNPVHLGSSGDLETATIGMLGLATVVANFAYNGYGNAVYLGEEIHEAPKHIARTILIALLIGVVAEVVPITAVLLGAPDLRSLLGSQNMFSDFIVARGGDTLNTIVSLGIALAIINASIAFLIMVARQLFSSGRDHVWSKPVNHALTRVHKRFHSPWVATLACGSMAALGCLIPLNFLLVLTGTGIVVIYAALCLAVLVGRRRGKTKHGHYRMPLFPWPPVIALVALGYVIYANCLDPEVGRPSLIATACMMAVAAAYYGLVLRRRGKWVLRGPEDV